MLRLIAQIIFVSAVAIVALPFAVIVLAWTIAWQWADGDDGNVW